MRVDKCRTCPAPVIWAETERGKWMPVDAEPSDGGNVQLEDRGSRVPLARVVKTDSLIPVDGPLHTSHFATCPYADHHRKRGT